MPPVYIREFELKDRPDVRRISCETAFLGESRSLFIDDDEILADALTLYHTDHEPESCFVAVDEGRVVGYVLGTKDAFLMDKISSEQIFPALIKKAFQRRFFFKIKTWALFFQVAISALKGEFFAPHFFARYPAMLHINIDKNYRGNKLGTGLIENYLNFLKTQGVKGVHFGAMSEDAKVFFLRSGFKLLHTSKRSYLVYRIGKTVPFYIFGKELGSR
jgi:ribosomal protein S18 acetylase RimI-like enzyme